MADKDIGQAELVLQVLQQVQHLRLHRHVQRAHGLVEHQHVRVQRQAARDRHPLALAAAELVRVLAEGAAVQPDLDQQLARALLALGGVAADGVDLHRLDERTPDREARVQARIRVLEHDLDAPAHRLALAVGELQDVAAVEDHLAAGGLVQPQQRQAHRRLARPRLADHPQRVAAPELEVDILHRLELALAEQPLLDEEALGQRAHLQHDRRSRVLGLGDGAAGLGGRRGGRAGGDVVVDHHQPRRVLAQARAAGQQRLGVGILRGGEDARHRPLLADHAVTHHDDMVGDLADDTQVVADEQHAHAVALAQAADQLEDLALDRHVQRRRRLVGDQQLGLAGQRHRDHHALLLAAGELVRVARQTPLGLGHADLGEQLLGALQRRAPAQPEVAHERLDELRADGEDRVERLHRVLEDAGDLLAADRLQLGQPRLQQVAPLPQHLPAALGVVGQQRQHRHRGHALAGARFADQRRDRVLGHVEAHATDRLGDLRHPGELAHAEADLQVPDRQQRAHSSPLSFGSSASRTASASSENAVTNTAMNSVAAASCHQ